MTKIGLLVFSLLFVFSGHFLHAQAPQTAIKVEMRLDGSSGEWQLYRGGQPYYIKGIGGQTELDRAVAYGANSVRTWGVGEAINVLDKAHEKGLTVLFGLWVGCERQGFDYDDSKAVQAQLERFTEVVKEYKDHPAILMWGIGNETDLFYSDFKVWNAIDDIAKMIKEVDPIHPTMTVTAGLDVAEVQLIMERAPHIDVYGINTYGGLIGIDKEMRAYGWDKPYVITEWGPNGHWEVSKTKWGVPIEQTSTEKAADYKRRYEQGILRDKEMCDGSYVFLRRQKQETTPTWYGLFLDDGSETEVMDVLEKAWSGKFPVYRSPSIASMNMNGKQAIESVYVAPKGSVRFEIDINDPDGDPLKYRWEILPESTDIKSGGDKDSRPAPVEIVIKPGSKEGVLNFKAPRKEGPYRLFAYIYDGNGNAATANFPFYVKRDE